MRRRFSFSCLLLLGAACGGSRPPPPHVDVPDAAPPPPPPPVVVKPAPARPPLPPNATYEEALDEPEDLNVQDTRAHLTDLQLTNPMRDVLGPCRVPRNAKVTIKVAVREGRAIGVTVLVKFDHGPSPRPLSPAAAKYEAKAAARIAECADKATRALTWPPSLRRDSFTTEF